MTLALVGAAAIAGVALVLFGYLVWSTRSTDKGPSPATAGPSTDSGLVERVDAEKLWNASHRRKGDRRRLFRYGTRPEPIPAFRGPVEDPPAAPGKRVGICCSGGGIRSAAFNLGALQSLQDADKLKSADYLAAVSGGSYIAAAFSMVAKTDTDDDSDPELLATSPPFARLSPEVQYLRNRSSYMAPDAAGKIVLGLRVILGLLFNLVFISLPLFAVTLFLGAVAYKFYLPHLVTCTDKCRTGIRWYGWVAPGVLLAASVMIGWWGMIRRAKDDPGQCARETWATRTLIGAAVLAFFMLALPALAGWVLRSSATTAAGAPTATTGGVAGGVGVTGLVGALLLQLRSLFDTTKKAVGEIEGARAAVSKLSTGIRMTLVYLAGGVLGPALLVAVMVFALVVALANSPSCGIDGWLVLDAADLFAIFLLLYSIADLTAWSLHPFYKRRLSSAFALKRVRPAALEGSDPRWMEREQIPYEDLHGVAVERDFDTLVRLSDTKLSGGEWPTLIICAAANISDAGATPPGRKVTSFTFSANSIGGPLVGGIATTDFEGAFGGDRPHDFSLPAAVAMSGAALSPSMGKTTRRPLTFLLALANVRLGVWVPNPRWVAATAENERRIFGRPRPLYLLRELLGLNGVNDRYLYVTDGGHYENLGLVELLRRGCTQIYCFDASGGESFADFGDAIALARSELGVEIKMTGLENIRPNKETDLAESQTAVGTFKYMPDGPSGTLVYARNVLTADASSDVKGYHERDPRFPHNSTVDQLYTDQKFEGYRALGEQAGAAAVEEMLVATTPPVI